MPKTNKTTRKKKSSRLNFQWNFQNIVFLAVVVIFAVSLIWSESISHLFGGINLQDANPLPTPTTLWGTPTPLPADYFSNSEQTNGVLLGAVVLGLIIIAGTIGILVRDRS